MMNINQTTIENIIKQIRKSIVLHTDSIENIHHECFCNPDHPEIKCYRCKIKESIANLESIKSDLYTVSKNTVNHVSFVDVESFCYSIAKQNNIKSININPVWQDPNAELNFEEKPIGFTIDVTISLEAYSWGMYHGDEVITFQWSAIHKRELGIVGIPYLLSAWVVNPNQFELVNKDVPEEDAPVHDEDCEFKDSDSFDNCDCAICHEGYFPPENDYFETEMQNMIDTTDWEIAQFNSDNREWRLGYITYNMNEFESNPDYKSACLEDDGMPSFGNY